MKNCAVILAGGEGKRMKSDKPKTLSEVLGRPMLCWVMSALRKAGIKEGDTVFILENELEWQD